MRLRVLRRATQEDIANLLGVTVQTVRNWEAGRTEPKLSLKQWDKLSAFLDVTIEQMPRDFAPQPIHNTAPRTTQN
jgi:DNA-binding XRE family transcriptional regulator